MTMHGDFDTPGVRGAIARRAGQQGTQVILEHIDVIGVRLAISLLEAGYRVLGKDVSESSRDAFERAGGEVIEASTPGNAVWTIECREQPNPRPEILSRMTTARSAYGRPRLELTSAQGKPTGSGNRAIAALIVRPADHQQGELDVKLGVTARGPELTVRGERSLFERALPLLTTLADRVLYDASSPGRPN